ncbi:hypothetical protein U27_05161 [Candidatus Vecturithrix granuli]|uniref:Uncharacterized protein n=1 Tax=Vecturithrix granuli TaxID=1499967 RepID=A0A081C0T3_VECG1|nr:hypothetical protein U27_05161 [Candidatus Vecturithrix granuli]
MDSKKFMFMTVIFISLNFFHNCSFASETRVVKKEQFKEGEITIHAMNDRDLLMLRKDLYSIPDYEADKTSVAAMSKLDINKDGEEDIVALVNLGGTIANPVEVFLLYSRKDDFMAQMLFTERAMMEKTVIDLNNDGFYEVCVNTSIVGDTPHAMVFYWVDIYAWDGQTYRQQNEQFFESFYIRHYLPQISERIARAEELLQLKESNQTISSVLEDCRAALGNMLQLQTMHSSLKSLRRTVEIDNLRQALPIVSNQIASAQQLLDAGGESSQISVILEKSQEILDRISTIQNAQ